MASTSEDFSSTNTLKFEKLNESNYRTWSFNIKFYLQSLDLFERVDETGETPEGYPIGREVKVFQQPAKKEWDVKGTYICLAIDSYKQIHARDTKTAQKAWNALKTRFTRTSTLQNVRL